MNRRINEDDMARRKQIKGVRKAMTKSQVYSEIADQTGLTKKEVSTVFDELGSIIERHIKKGSVGTFNMAGFLKIKTVKKPARKARKGVPNPFRPGELMDIKAKPASIRVKVLPLKKLKEMV